MSIQRTVALECDHDGCMCGASRLHRAFRFYWDNPCASRRDAARALKMSEGNVRAALYRLRKRNLTRLCPGCMQETIFRGVCQNCGIEPSAPIVPFEANLESQSPTNNIHPGNQLGSDVDYASIGFVNHWLVLKRRVERGMEDPLIKAVKSDVENELKRSYPTESVTDEAGRLAIKEVLEFRARYPALATSKKVRAQLAERVIRRIRLIHPHLKIVTALPLEATP